MKYNGLIRILDKELQIYEQLYELTIKKVEIIKKGKIEALNEFMKKEQKLVTNMQMMENERHKELKRLYPAETELVTISRCIRDAEGKEKAILQNVYERLSQILQRTKQQNELNQQLLVNSLQFVNFSLQLFHPRPDTMTYQPKTGKQENYDTPSLFNSEA
ncbi:flagellar protein FlgN [Fervidibacillus albus]|uniref:Flagellar protein FlgN n=1 Tax=Fervidibacillus albus TaxID=2980026 RepID=A0A9E8LUW7_9BACI|nr:flagellar protein FlgN [Fervidibacillus albus]WAA09785.1 flagellar protein FlgN [Fervidibacillus albus]